MYYGALLQPWNNEGIVIRNEVPLDTHKMVLFAGGTGSGKTQSIITQLGLLIKEGVRDITLCDFKGIDFQFLNGYRKYYSGDFAFDGIMAFYEEFTQARHGGTVDKQHHILIVDEYPSLLTYFQTKDKADRTKRANDIMSAISEMLMLGRGLNYGVWISCQRASSSWFENGSRDNFQVICALGRLSKEQRQMLFSGEDFDANIRIYGPGTGLCLADGRELVEVQFPLISDLANWKEHIRQELMTSGELSTV
ncbi:MAG: hypothetical protein E7304_05875 [Butyrivibrio sp.]|uniref:FtsK domain-containing protein n=1 Tax=Pseudobutyrivibrio ruminis TaxID=46206 RepID=A0A927U9W9_9FIRM|nr:hypothetical protein [Butyrivibrio sp.]MBE5840919.1 hypothetical protein [Butyrivibrio sp.]MBE5921086.1 hypothetical protein [Pseudobutyrivibrio ruminis]